MNEHYIPDQIDLDHGGNISFFFFLQFQTRQMARTFKLKNKKTWEGI